MFKIGDIVYCIDNFYTMGKKTSSLLQSLVKDKPYTIESIIYDYKTKITLKEVKNTKMFEQRFISEKEYKKISRIEKINNINKIKKQYENFKKK